MHERRARRRLVEREPVLLMGENVLDGAEAKGPQALGAQTGGFQPVRAVVPPEAHQTQTGAVALFGMRPIGEDAGDDAARRRAGLLGPGDQPRRRPLGVGAMRAARLSRQEGAGSADMPTRLFNVASLSQLPGVAPETLARLSPELTIYTGRPLPDMALADARMRSALVAAGKAAGAPVGNNNANGSGMYDIDVVASRQDRPPGRVQVVLQWTPRYDGGIEVRWLAWEHGRWQQ